MVRTREKITNALENALDDITVELAFIRGMCEQKAEDYSIPMDDVIEALRSLEEVIS